MVKLLYIDKDYAERIEKAGKSSTEKEPCDPEGFTRRIVKAQHLSLGRFANATFEVECSRACGNQLESHPHLNFCQESQRYVEMPKLNSKMAPSEIAKYCVIPPSVKIDKILFYEYLAALFESYRIIII